MYVYDSLVTVQVGCLCKHICHFNTAAVNSYMPDTLGILQMSKQMAGVVMALMCPVRS